MTGHPRPWRLPESLGLFTPFNTTGLARAVAGHLFTPKEDAILQAQHSLNSMAEVKALLGQQLDQALVRSIHTSLSFVPLMNSMKIYSVFAALSDEGE